MKILLFHDNYNYEEISITDLQFRLDYYIDTYYVVDKIDNNYIYIYEKEN